MKLGIIGSIVVFYCGKLYSQTDTVFVGKRKAFLTVTDTAYENFKKKIVLTKNNSRWYPTTDTIFYGDGNIFRIRKYFYPRISNTIDTFYQSPYSDGTKYISSIVFSIGKLSIVQKLQSNVEGHLIYIWDNSVKRPPPYDNLLLYKSDKLSSYSKPVLATDSLGLKLKLNSKHLISKIIFGKNFNFKYYFNKPLKYPVEIILKTDGSVVMN